jgi:DNA-binding NarL/FixJ family response regulator
VRPVRIAIADDHQIFRDGLKRLLESEEGFTVVAEAADGVEAIQMALAKNPDLLLLDVAMPRMDGLETLAALQAENTKIMLLTAGMEPTDLLRAVRLGARGIVLKESATRSLIEGIHQVLAGKYVIGDGVADDPATAIGQVPPAAARPYNLTARELQVVSLIVAAASNRDMAERLGISLQTVKHHITNIFDKTGVSTRLELALLALRHGLADTD